jgi:hypothetical protein
MKRLVLVLLAAAVLQAATAGAAHAQDAEAKYQTMLAAARKDPAAADWKALRLAYADRPSFSPYGDLGDRSAMRKAWTAGDWEGLRTAANKLLDANYADGEAHLALAFAYRQLGKREEAGRARAIAAAIFKSMMRDGNGKSPEQAIVVISVAEEYALMAALGRRVVRQRLMSAGKHAYDALDTTGPKGDTVTFYFQIDRVLAAQARALGSMRKRKQRPE